MVNRGDGLDYRVFLAQIAEFQSRLLNIDARTSHESVLRMIAQGANQMLNGYFSVAQPYLGTIESGDFLTSQFVASGHEVAEQFRWLPPRPNGVSRAVLSGGLVLVEDLDNDARDFLRPTSENRGSFRDIAAVKSLIGVRMDEAGDVLGVLFTTYQQPRQFSDAEILATRIIASQAGIALRTLRQVKERELQRRLDAAVAKIDKSAGAKSALAEIAQAARDILEADSALIIPYDEAPHRFLTDDIVAVGPGSDRNENTYPREDGASVRLVSIKSTEPIIRQFDAASDELWTRLFSTGAFKKHAGHKTIIGMSLRYAHNCVGVLYFGYEGERFFTQDERTLIQHFGEASAEAITNARRLDMERQQRELSLALQSVAEYLNRDVTANQILDRILETLADIFDFESASIFVLDEFSGELVRARDRGYTPSRVGERYSWEDKPIVAQMRDGKRPILIQNTEGNATWVKGSRSVAIKSYLGAPLIIRGQARGFINLNRDQPFSFPANAESLIQSYAQQAAIAWDNVLSYHTLDRVQETGRKIVAQAMRPKSSLQSLLQFIIARTHELFRFDVAQILRVAGDKLRIVADDIGEVGSGFKVFDLHQSISGQSILHKRTINLRDLTPPLSITVQRHGVSTKIALDYAPPAPGLEMRSEIVVPLMQGDVAIGAYNIESAVRDAFDEREQKMLETLCGYVALAIPLAEYRMEAEALSEVATQLTQRTTVDEVMPAILNSAMELIGAQFGQLLMKSGDILRIDYVSNNWKHALGQSHAVADCNSGLAVLHKRPVIINDVRKQLYHVVDFTEDQPTLRPHRTPRLLYKEPLLLPGSQRMNSEMVVPLMKDGDVIGVLNMESPHEYFFAPQDARLLQSYGELAASTMDRAKKLARDAEQQSLDKVSDAVHMFGSGLTHIIRSPSLGIEFDTRVIRSRFQSLLDQNPELEVIIRRMEASAMEISAVPNKIAENADAFQPSYSNVYDLLKETFETLNRTRPSIASEIIGMLVEDESVHDASPLRCDSITHLVFDNLLTNAYEAMKRASITDGRIWINAVRDPANATLEVRVTDNGPGIPEPIRNAIFARDFTARDSQKGGVGLWWVKQHMKVLGGDVKVEDGPRGRGVTFILIFPVSV